MGKENLTFGDIEIGRDKFYRYKNPIFLENLSIENVLVSN